MPDNGKKPKAPATSKPAGASAIDYKKANAIIASQPQSSLRTLKTDTSTYDSGFIISGNDPLGDLQEQRAQRQSGWEQLGFGVVKGTVLAGTTTINSLVGLPVGIASALGAAASGKSANEALSKLYDNPITNAMEEFNKASETYLPNYYTKKEQNADALSPDNWFTANFLGDKLLKNAGFTVGAMVSGNLVARGASALGKIAMSGRVAAELAEVQKLADGGMELYKAFDKVAKTSKAVNAISRGSAALVAATGEGSAEALSAKEETKAELLKELTSKVGAQGRKPTEQELAEVERLSNAAGNTTLGMNIPLLMASDLIQFGKVLGGGFNKEMKALSAGRYAPILKESTYEAAKATGKAKAATIAGKLLIDPLTESFEEGAQTAIQAGSKSYALRKYDKPQGEYFHNLMASTIDGLAETFNTKEGREGMLLGFLTGNISHLVTGGVSQDLADIKAKEANSAAAADFLNKWREKSGGKELLETAIRARAISADMDDSLQSGNKFEYKNLEHDLLKNLVQGSISRGTYDLLLEKLEDQKSMSPEDFKEAYGVDADIESVDKYISKLQAQVKSLKSVFDQVQERFPNASPQLKEAFFDGISNIRDLEKREIELNEEAKSPGGKMQPQVKGIDLLMLKKATALAGTSYEEAINKELVSMSPDVADVVLKAVNEIEKVRGRKEHFGRVYKALLEPQAEQVVATAHANAAAAQAVPASAAKVEEAADEDVEDALGTDGVADNAAAAPVVNTAPATQPAAPVASTAPAVGTSAIISPSSGQPYLATSVWAKPLAELRDSASGNKILPKVDIGSTIGAEINPITGKVVRYFKAADITQDAGLTDEQKEAYDKMLERYQQAAAPITGTAAPAVASPSPASVQPIAPTSAAGPRTIAQRLEDIKAAVPSMQESYPDEKLSLLRTIAQMEHGNWAMSGQQMSKEGKALYQLTVDRQAELDAAEPSAPYTPPAAKTFNWQPQDYKYAQIAGDNKAFTGKDTEDQPLRDEWLKRMKDPNHPQNSVDVMVVKENNYQYNLYTQLDGKDFKLGYLKTTTGARALPATASQETADAFRQIEALKAAIAKHKGPVKLLFQLKTTLNTKADTKTPKSLAQLDKRFTFNGDYVVIEQRKVGSLVPFKSVIGEFTPEDAAAIEKLGLTDGYIIKVSQPSGNDGSYSPARYIAAKTLPSTEANFKAVEVALKSGNEALIAKIIQEQIFVASKVAGTHIKAVGANLEVLNNGAANINSKVGYLRFKKDAVFTDEASFIDALEFTPVGKNPVPQPASNYISSVRQQLSATDNEQQKLEKLLPAVSEDIYNSISMEPVGVDADVAEPTAFTAPVSIKVVAKAGEEAAGDIPVETTAPVKKKKRNFDEEQPDADLGSVTAFKTYANEVVSSTDFQKAAENLRRILPAEFGVKDIEKLAKSIYGNGNLMAAYVDMNIYLAKATEKSVEYHEAFHAVFRALMSPADRKKYYAIADRQFKISPKQVAAFKSSAPQYNTLSDAAAKTLLLEEKMADAFQSYMNGKPTTLLGRVFAYLKKMVSSFFNNGDEIKALFMKIDNGGFKHAPIIRETGFEKETAFKVIPRMSVEQSQKAVRLLAVRFAKAKGAIAGGLTREEADNLLEKLIRERAEEDVQEGDFSDEQLEQLNLTVLDAEEAKEFGLKEGVNYRNAYLYKQSKAVLKEMVMKQNAYLEYIVQEQDENLDLEDSEQDNADADEANAKSEKIGSGGILEVSSINNVSQEIRQVISYTTYGEGASEQAVDFGQTVSVLERILENVRSFDEMAAKVEARIQDGENQQLKAVWENLQAYFVGESGELYKRKFEQGFYRILVSPLQLTASTESNQADLFTANQRDIAKERVGQFRNQWVVSKATHAEGVAELKALVPKLTAASTTDMDAALLLADDVVKALNKLGVDLSKTFLRSVVRGTNEAYRMRKGKDESGVEYYGLIDQINSIVSQHSLGRNPFDGERADNNKQGATFYAELLAAEDAKWRDTILNPSYRNAEGKSQYAYTQPSFVLERARDLQDGKVDTSGEYMALNELVRLNKEDKGATFSSLATGVFSGIRVKEAGEGQTFGSLDNKTFFLSVYAAYQNGYAMPFQFESKSTTMLTKLPQWKKGYFFEGGKVTDEALTSLRNMVAQELLDIERVHTEVESMDDNGLKTKAVKNRHFTSWDTKTNTPNRVTREQVEAARVSGNMKGIPRGMYVSKFPDLSLWSKADLADKAKLDNYFRGFVDSLMQEHASQLAAAGWDTADKKVQALLMGKGAKDTWNEFSGEFLLRDFIFTEAYSQLVRGSEDYFKDGVDITKRAAGMLAAGPGAGKGSFNMAMLQTDSFHIYTDTMMPVSDEDQAILDGKEAPSSYNENLSFTLPASTTGQWLKEADEISPDGICDATSKECILALKEAGYKVALHELEFSAKSPIGDWNITHKAALALIGDKYYLYDMPQTEFLDKQIGNGTQIAAYIKLTKPYSPRFIELTKENLVKYYGSPEKEFDNLSKNLAREDGGSIWIKNTTRSSPDGSVVKLINKMDAGEYRASMKDWFVENYPEKVVKRSDDEIKALQEATAFVDATDAQGHMTGLRFKHIMMQQAQISVDGLKAIDKVIAGEELSPKEMKTFTANSIKNIYYGQDADGAPVYIKTSNFPLFKAVTSFKNKNGEWVAKPGMEKLHNLREQLEAIDGETGAEAYHETAVKLGQKAMNFRGEDGNYANLLHRPLENKNWRKQVETPSGKDKITDGTQLLQILDSGMKDEDKIEFEGKQATVGELRKEYQRLLSDLRVSAHTKFADLQNSFVDGVNLYKEGLVSNLEASNSDQNTLDFFKTQNGKWVMSTDLPAIQQKFQEMVLSSWNKNVFSHKNPGRKLSLVASSMAEVIVDANGNLAHDWSKPYGEQTYLDENGKLKDGYKSRKLNIHTLAEGKIAHAEVMLSEEILFQRGITLADLYGPKTSEATRNSILEELGFRIPSQDKHSMMPFKIVGWLPAYMGSVAIAPAQITYLSGADYDIDSLFTLRREFYKGADGGIKLYGEAEKAGDIKEQFSEYLQYQEKNNPHYTRIVQQRERASAEYAAANTALSVAKANLASKVEKENILQADIASYEDAIEQAGNEDVSELVVAKLEAINEIAGMQGLLEEVKNAAAAKKKIQFAIREQVRVDLGLAPNLAYFTKHPKGTPYSVQNKLMDVRMALATNPHDWEAAKAPAAMEKTDELAKLLPPVTGAGKVKKLPYNTFVNRATDRNNNMAGAANIGPNAKGNITGAFLSKHDYELNVPIRFGNITLTGYTGYKDRDMVLAMVDGKLEAVGETVVDADGNVRYKGAVDVTRKQDSSSDMISTATDNAKNPKAAFLNYTTSNLAIIQNLIHLGAGLRRATVFVNQPILIELSKRQQQAGSLVKGFEQKGDVLRNMLYEYEQLLKGIKLEVEVQNGMEDRTLVKNLSGKLKNYVVSRTPNGRAKSFSTVSKSEAEFIVQQIDVLRKYQELDSFTTSSFSMVGRVLALNKGVGSDFQSLDKFQAAVENLTWMNLDTGLEVEAKPVGSPGTELEFAL